MDNFRFSSEPFTREFRIEHRMHFDFIENEVHSLKNVIETRQSAALLAPAGAGKTVALRALRALLPEARYRVSYLKLSDLSVRDMCRQIATALGAEISGHFPSLVRHIEQLFQAGFDGGIRPVVIFDDAHELRPATLRLVRLLTNFDMDSQLIVSVVLVGHPQLKELLMRQDLEDVRQRLVYRGEIRLLSREETAAYAEHRAKIAGCLQNPFAAQACEAIYEITRGNMRAIDALALAALTRASRAKRDLVEAADVAVARTTLWM